MGEVKGTDYAYGLHLLHYYTSFHTYPCGCSFAVASYNKVLDLRCTGAEPPPHRGLPPLGLWRCQRELQRDGQRVDSLWKFDPEGAMKKAVAKIYGIV